MELSVVVPVYNEEKRIRKSILRLTGYLRRRYPSHEVIVVDDGSTDKTAEILAEIPKRGEIRILRNERNHGKGYAVRQGVLAAKGGIIFFTDADLSTPVQEIGRFRRIFEKTDAQILIGSRSIRGAQIKIKQPCYRMSMGKVFNGFVRLLTPLRFGDTQCGFKGFGREAARKIFSSAKENRFAFDVEILLLARRYGFKVEEVPVAWVNSRKSKVRPIEDSARMFLDLVKLRKFAKVL